MRVVLRFKIEIEHVTRREDVKAVTTTLVFETINSISLSAIEDACHEASSYCERLMPQNLPQ